MKKLLAFILSIFILMPGLSIFAEEQSSDNNLFDSEEWVIEEITYEEMIERISDENGTTIEETKILYPDTLSSNQRATESYQYLSAQRAFAVTSSYRPAMTFYLEVENDSSGSPVKMNRVVRASLNRNNTLSNGVGSKLFDGEIFYELLSSTQLYFQVNGDSHNNGSISGGASVQIGIGESAKLTFQVTASSSHYAYCWYEDLLELK